MGWGNQGRGVAVVTSAEPASVSFLHQYDLGHSSCVPVFPQKALFYSAQDRASVWPQLTAGLSWVIVEDTEDSQGPAFAEMTAYG